MEQKSCLAEPSSPQNHETRCRVVSSHESHKEKAEQASVPGGEWDKTPRTWHWPGDGVAGGARRAEEVLAGAAPALRTRLLAAVGRGDPLT